MRGKARDQPHTKPRRSPSMLCYSGELPDFCRQLQAAVPNLTLWAAGIWPLQSPPAWLTVEDTLTTPLRCPPAVQRQVEQSRLIGRDVPNYSTAPWPAATEGPAVEWMEHRGQRGHRLGAPENCDRCGQQVGRRLLDLGVGQPGG